MAAKRKGVKRQKGVAIDRAAAIDQTQPAGVIGKALNPARIHDVFLWVTLGMTEFQIVEQIAQRWPGEDARLLMAAAFQQIANTGEMDAKLIRGWCIEAAREQYRRAVLVSDIPAAIQALRLVAMAARQ